MDPKREQRQSAAVSITCATTQHCQEIRLRLSPRTSENGQIIAMNNSRYHTPRGAIHNDSVSFILFWQTGMHH